MVAVERTKVHEMAVWSATALEYVKTTGMFLLGDIFLMDHRPCHKIHFMFPFTIIHFLFERSEFLIDTSQKKSLRVCTRAVCTRARVFDFSWS